MRGWQTIPIGGENVFETLRQPVGKYSRTTRQWFGTTPACVGKWSAGTVFFLAVASVVMGQNPTSMPTIPLVKDTTFVNEPLKPDGTVDFDVADPADVAVGAGAGDVEVGRRGCEWMHRGSDGGASDGAVVALPTGKWVGGDWVLELEK
jgi:hypothetical protein